MKKHPQNDNHPLRLRAQTLRHLRRDGLAEVAGGVTGVADRPADCSTDGWTQNGQPTTGGTTTV